MKILIAVTTDIAFDQRVLRIAGSLGRYGHHVKVLGRNKGIAHHLSGTFEYSLISCWFSKSILFYAEYNIRLFCILMSSRFDVVCACDLDTILAATLASTLKKKKLVFDAHEYMEESIEIIHKDTIKKIWNWIGKICIPQTQMRYTVSQSLVDELSTKYHSEFKLIRNVPQTILIPGNQNRQKIIWYQGAINEGRGLGCLIECMTTLKNYSLYMAGDGDLLAALKNTVKNLNLENRVRFLGRLSYKEMSEYASRSFIGIDLLESKSKSYYFSLSNKTFDYMHASLPCIQMNFPEYKNIHMQFNIGVLVEAVEKHSILKAIEKLENPEYYYNCIQNCKEAAKFLNWESEEKNLIELYNHLLV